MLLAVVLYLSSQKLIPALVAQLDRVTGYEPVGQGFESLPARQEKSTSEEVLFSMISVSVETGDIPCGYDICFADDIRFAYEKTDIISYLRSKYIIR